MLGDELNCWRPPTSIPHHDCNTRSVLKCPIDSADSFLLHINIVSRCLDMQNPIFQVSFFNRVTLCVSAAIAVVAWLSVTCRYWIETDKDIIKLFSRPCSPTTMVFYYHIRLRNCNGRGSLSLGWTSFSVWKHSMCSRVARLLLNRHRIPMKVVQLIRNWGLRFQIRNYFTSITYGSRGIAHAHCQFCDLRLKSPSISETVRYRPMVPMER